jgi:hypothetical protein
MVKTNSLAMGRSGAQVLLKGTTETPILDAPIRWLRPLGCLRRTRDIQDDRRSGHLGNSMMMGTFLSKVANIDP